MIAYFASDLIWATRIKGVAEDLGFAARPVRTVQMLHDRLSDSPVRGLIVDLDQPETALELVRAMREWEKEAHAATALKIIAFGPHVEAESLAAALRMGANAALTRGAFHHKLADVITDIERGER